jgi:molybdate transport system substrate-binding protein
MIRILTGLIAILLAGSPAAADAPAVRLHAAGSLRAPMTDIAKAYTDAYGISVQTNFGASGAMRDRLANGEPGDVFASADMGNPLALTNAGKAGPVVLFARNHLCAIVRPGLDVTSENILTKMLDPSIKVGTATPGNDPGGDYAWELFRKADAQRPGSRATLEAKALKIGNVAGSLAVPPGVTNAVVWLFKEKRVDIFLAYCTGGRSVAAELPGVATVALPPALAVEANYGLTTLTAGNRDRAAQFAFYILSPAAQKILADHGFDAPLLPTMK